MEGLNFKKASSGDVWISPFFFVVWILVIAFLMIGVYLFFNSQGDTRPLEAKSLGIWIFDCLRDYDYEDFATGFNIYEKCSINDYMFRDNSLLYFRAVISKPEYDDLIFENVEAKSFEGDCEIQFEKIKEGKGTYENLPQCFILSREVLDDFWGEYTINILSVSNQR